MPNAIAREGQSRSRIRFRLSENYSTKKPIHKTENIDASHKSEPLTGEHQLTSFIQAN